MLLAVKYHMRYFCVQCITVLLFNIFLTAQNKNTVPAHWPEPVFEHLTIADGLPENSVFSMLQDRFGYMWLGTQNGLVRYDGYSMKVYTRDPDDTLSISDRTITAIYEDKSGTLWIGTDYGGLNRFDRKTETFTRYMHNPDDSTSISNDRVYCINEDIKGNILIGTEGGLALLQKSKSGFKTINKITDNGKIIPLTSAIKDILVDSLTGNIYVSNKNVILIYDSEKNLLREDEHFPGVENELSAIHSLYQANDGTIWIGHSNGLAKFNSLKNTFKFYQPVFSKNINVENYIGKIAEDDKGYIWGATNLFTNNDQNSLLFRLICFNPVKENFHLYEYDPQNESSLSSGPTNLILQDRSGIIWVGTWSGGLNKWDSKKQKFTRYRSNPVNFKDKSFGMITTIAEDQGGLFWLGTENLGLLSFDHNSNKFKNYWKEPKEYVHGIYFENSEIIWFGTHKRGLGKYNRSKRTFQFYFHDPYDSTSISNNTVSYILPDGKDILWIGTMGGLNKFYMHSGKFIHYSHDPNNRQSIGNNNVFCIYKDKLGTMWIGTNTGGLNKFNPVDETFESYHFTKGIGVTTVEAIYEDKKGNLWVGTYQSGLHLFDRKSETSVFNITEKDGLANNEVNSIVEDDSENLWIGTNNGLSKFDPKTRTFKNFYFSGGIDQNRFYIKAIKSSTGEMFFSMYDGFIMFHPDSIKDDPVPPQVVISNVSLFNRPGEKLEFDGFISELKELNFSYNENDLRFEYVGLHYGDPSKNKYKYMLVGYDDDWVDAGTQRNAVYTNLDAGKLELKASRSNIVSLIKGITMSFESIAEKKDISLKVKAEKAEIELYFDKEKIIKIMTNLLSNAFKFTNDGGQITVTVSHADLVSASHDGHKIPIPIKSGRNDNIVEISIKDTGIGISEEELPKLFDRFYQVDNSHTREHEGTGIGLALTKELVELHHGTISVASKLACMD